MEDAMTPSKHLQWCKNRALAYCDAGDAGQAFASMLSDMRKHPDTADNPALWLGAQLRFGGHMNTVAEVRKFIDGFI